MKNTPKKYGFTLIELLVVIAIIALLAGLLFPAVGSALNTAKKGKAKSTCQNIETAIMLYANEYGGKLPIPATAYGNNDSLITDADSVSKDILMVLMNINSGSNTGYALNPKKIVFLETDIPSDDGEYLDPWGTQYRILLDKNLDGSIAYLTNANAKHRKKAVVVSAGKDRTWGSGTAKDNSNKDNVANVDLPLLN